MTTTEGRRLVLMIAWAFARHGAFRFGGMPRELFIEALRQTWTAIRTPKTERARVLASAIWKRAEFIGNKRDGEKWPTVVEVSGRRIERA
jgi:hypothetical protein